MVLLLAITAGAFLRWHNITELELQYDEAATGYFAALPWADLWGRPALLEPNPPLFYSIARLVMLAGGDVEHIRYVSAAAGTFCIPAAWLLGRSLAGGFAAGAAAWLVATSPQNIAISQYARTYALLSLVLLGAVLCLVLARRTPAKRWRVWWWACYTAVSMAALYLHYTAIVILAALNTSALLCSLWPPANGGHGRRFRFGLLIANAAVALAYVPWLPVLVHQAAPAGGLIPAAPAHARTLLQRFVLAVHRRYRFNGLPWLNGWWLSLTALGGWRFRASQDVMTLVLCAIGGPLMLFTASQFHPMLDGKTLAWAGLFILLGTALGLQSAGKLGWPVLAILLLVQLQTNVAQALDTASRREGWAAVASMLRREAVDHDVVFINDTGAILALRHYHWPEASLDIRILAKPDAEPWFRDPPGAYATGPGAVSVAAANHRVWILTYNATSTNDDLARQADGVSTRQLFTHAGRLDATLLVPAAP